MALPREVWAHGYVQWEGAKMSKSAGTAVSLDEAIDRHGPDALRYFLLREVGFEADGNFTWERFDERYTADLADGLGNLASRSLAMLAKYRDGVVPRPRSETTLDQAGRQARRRVRRGDGRADLRGGAEAAWELVATANLYIQQVAPWAPGQGRQGGRAGCRARGAGPRAVPAGGAGRPVHPGQSPSALAIPGLARESSRSAWVDLERRRRWRAWLPTSPRCCSPSHQLSRS